MNCADFNRLYFECRDALPTAELKRLFDSAMVGGMSAYVPDSHVRRVMSIALDAAQSFNQPRLQLVRK